MLRCNMFINIDPLLCGIEVAPKSRKCKVFSLIHVQGMMLTFHMGVIQSKIEIPPSELSIPTIVFEVWSMQFIPFVVRPLTYTVLNCTVYYTVLEMTPSPPDTEDDTAHRV